MYYTLKSIYYNRKFLFFKNSNKYILIDYIPVIHKKIKKNKLLI